MLTSMFQAREIVLASTGLQQTRALAQDYIDKAIEAIAPFPESEAKNGLVEMCTKVLQRRK
jgi:hexaprenyl-diphosphate synthase